MTCQGSEMSIAHLGQCIYLMLIDFITRLSGKQYQVNKLGKNKCGMFS